MSYNQKKFLDYDGLVHLLKKFDDYPTNDILGTVIDSIETAKADKVSSATGGNFAALDSTGNLTDSGHKHSDYLTQHQDISGKLDVSAIDDTAGAGDTDKVWSADKVAGSIPDISGKADKAEVLIKAPVFGNPKICVDTTTVSFSKDGDNDWYCSADNPVSFVYNDFNAKCVYKVEWDGVEYEVFFADYHVVSASGSGDYSFNCIGNAGLFGYAVSHPTDAPFAFAHNFRHDDAYVIFTSSTDASHTIKITKIPFSADIQPLRYYQPVSKYGAHTIYPGTGYDSVVIGGRAIDASGYGSISSGSATLASGNISHADGLATKASGNYSHSEGSGTTASGEASHAEGSKSVSSGSTSHAEGSQTTASGSISHAEGNKTTASGGASHAEGQYSTASGAMAHADGENTIANHRAQRSSGAFNVADPSQAAANQRGDYAEIIGNGTADNTRSNARTLDWSGNERLAGDVYVGCNADSSGGTKLAKVTDIPDIAGKAPVILRDVSGDLVTVTDGADGTPIKALVVQVGASESGRTGCMIYRTGASFSNGLTVENGYYDLDGSSKTSQNMRRTADYIQTEAGRTYVLCGTADSNGSRVRVHEYDENNGWLRQVFMSDTIANGMKFAFVWVSSSDAKYFRFSFPKCTSSDPMNVYADTARYIIDWQSEAGTIYDAAELDLISGILTVGQDAYQLTNLPEITMLHGINNLWADCGGISAEYPADTKIYVDTAVSAANAKADKVSQAVSGNFAGLDASGNLTDSGHKHSDYLTEHQSLADYVQKTDYATDSVGGVVKVSNSDYGLYRTQAGVLVTYYARSGQVKAGTHEYNPIVPLNQHSATFYGLAKAAGDSTQEASDNAVGTYTDDAKTAIQNMLGVSSSVDVNNKLDKSAVDNAGITSKTYTTIVDDTITTVADGVHLKPYATCSGSLDEKYKYRITFGNNDPIEILVGIWEKKYEGNDSKGYEFIGNISYYDSEVTGVEHSGLAFTYCIVYNSFDYSGLMIFTNTAGSYHIKLERIDYTVDTLPYSLMYGNEEAPIHKYYRNNSSYACFSVGDNATTSRGTIDLGWFNRSDGDFAMAFGIGNTASSIAALAEGHRTIASGDYSHAEGNKTTASGGASHAGGQNTVASGNFSVAEGDSTVASGSFSHAHGRHTVANGAGMTAIGRANVAASNLPTWVANTSYAVGDLVKNGTKGYKCITANSDATFTSSKWQWLASDSDTALVIGNGTADDARSNALKVDWAGTARFNGDVYVNCDADSTGGTKLISATDYASYNDAGVVKTGTDYGIGIETSGHCLYVKNASSDEIKAGTHGYRPITPSRQQESVFYGLAKAAGADESSSALPLGTYSQTAKTAIQTMLGVDGSVSFVEEVTGTTPTITGEPNVRYMCGEVSSITITPPTTGTIDVVFESGTTAALLTVNTTSGVTMKWPAWFDATALEVNTTYEINIMDGKLGAVMAW